MSEEMKKEKRVRRALLIAMLVTVLVVAASLTTIYTVRRVQRADWKTTTGTVTRRMEVYNFKIQVGYTYYVAGKKYDGKEIIARRKMKGHRGDTAEIWYDPDNPEDSTFLKPDPMFNAAPIVFPAAIIMLVLIIQYRKEED